MKRFIILVSTVAIIGCTQKTAEPKQAEFVPPPPSPPSMQGPVCATKVEKTAFNIIGLQSQLMQIALSCQKDHNYSDFVTKFKPNLREQHSIAEKYFTRAYGLRHAQSEHDLYITQLANDQSILDLKSGTEFCHFAQDFLDHVSKINSVDDLEKFSNDQPIQQAMSLTECSLSDQAQTPLKSDSHHNGKHQWKHSQG